MASWRRRAKRGALVLLGLVVLAVATALLALAYLDARPMKGWIQGAARERGIDLDFARARVTLGGLRLRRVVVASPAADAKLAPALFTVGSIDGRWTPWSKRLDELVIRDVAITIVRDPDGTTSLDRWLAGMPQAPAEESTSEPASPPDPLSRLARAVVPEGLEAHTRIENVKVTVLDRLGPSDVRTLELVGPAVKADLAEGKLALAIGPSPVALAMRGAQVAPAPDGGARQAVLQVRGEAELTAAGRGRFSLGAELQAQSLTPGLPPVKEVLKLGGTIDFLEKEGRTQIALEELKLLDGAGSMTARAQLIDVKPGSASGSASDSDSDSDSASDSGSGSGSDSGSDPPPSFLPVLDAAALRLDLVALAKAVPPELGPLEIEGEPLVAEVAEAAIAPVPRGRLTMRGKLARLRWKEIEIKGLGIEAKAAPLAATTTSGATPTTPAAPANALLAGGLRAELHIPVEQLTMPGLTVTGVEAKLTATRPPGLPAASTAADPLALVWPVQLAADVSVAAVTTPTEKVQGLTFDVDATAHSMQALDADLRATVAAVAAPAADVQTISLEAQTRGFQIDPLAPVRSTGVVTAKGSLAQLRDPTGKRAKDVAFTATATLAGEAPATAALTLDAKSLVVPGLGQSLGPAFAGGPLAAKVSIPRLELDAAVPAQSRGKALVTAGYGRATVEAEVEGSMQAVTWKLSAKVPRIGPPTAQASALAASSTGSFGVSNQTIDHDTTIELGALVTDSAALRGARLHLKSGGDLTKHFGKIDVALAGVTTGGKSLGAPRLAIVAEVDRRNPSIEMSVKGDVPSTDLILAAVVFPNTRPTLLRWKAKGKISGLAALAPFLPPGTDWQKLALELDGGGDLTGVVTAVKDGVPVLALDPATSARGRQKLAVTVKDLHYRDDLSFTSADVAAMSLRADVNLGATRTATVDVDLPAFSALASGVKLGAEELAMRFEASFTQRPLAERGAVTSADPSSDPLAALAGELDAKISVRAKSAKQSALPWYAVDQPELSLAARGDVTQKLALEMKMKNPGAGTAVELAGDLERELGDPRSGVVGRSSLAVTGKLAQNMTALGGLGTAPGTLNADGELEMPFQIESGDLSLFRATARLILRDVAVEMPDKKLRAAKISGELPVIQEIVLGPAGPELVGQGERGLFSQVRFPDYRPFADAADYLSIGELTYQGKSYGPLAGNARVDRDVVAVDQLEMTALGGKISGQCLAELRGKDTKLAFRGRLTGIRPSVPKLVKGAGATPTPMATGELLDANVAITVTPYRYDLEGRTEIVRIGKDHLLALLDLWDPYRADIAANRVRLALKVGYPEQVRLHFSRGFASLSIDLGGIAGIVRIDEIRGIPIGPALAHWLAPFLEQP